MDDLEEALSKQIETLRALLSSLVQEEQTYRKSKRMDERLALRLKLLECYEDAESKGLLLMEQYLLDSGKPSLLKAGLKIEQLLDFKKALSLDDVSVAIQIDQLVSLLEKIHDTNDNLRLLDQQGQIRPYVIIEEAPKKSKTRIGVID